MDFEADDKTVGTVRITGKDTASQDFNNYVTQAYNLMGMGYEVFVNGWELPPNSVIECGTDAVVAWLLNFKHYHPEPCEA